MSIRRRYWTNAKGEQKEAWIADYVDQHGKRHIKTFKEPEEPPTNGCRTLRSPVQQDNIHAPIDVRHDRTGARSYGRSALRLMAGSAGTLNLSTASTPTISWSPLDGRGRKLARLSRAQCEAVRDALPAASTPASWRARCW